MKDHQSLYQKCFMMRHLFQVTSGAFLIAVGLVLCGNAFAQTPIVIKFSHVVANDTPKGKAAERFRVG